MFTSFPLVSTIEKHICVQSRVKGAFQGRFVHLCSLEIIVNVNFTNLKYFYVDSLNNRVQT